VVTLWEFQFHTANAHWSKATVLQGKRQDVSHVLP